MSKYRNELFNRMKGRLRAGGNRDTGMKELASDFIGNSGLKDAEIAELAFISATTVDRLRKLTPTETGNAYRPQSDTLERVFRGLGAEISLTPVTIKSKFQNKPKDED